MSRCRGRRCGRIRPRGRHGRDPHGWDRCGRRDCTAGGQHGAGLHGFGAAHDGHRKQAQTRGQHVPSGSIESHLPTVPGSTAPIGVHALTHPKGPGDRLVAPFKVVRPRSACLRCSGGVCRPPWRMELRLSSREAVTKAQVVRPRSGVAGGEVADLERGVRSDQVQPGLRPRVLKHTLRPRVVRSRPAQATGVRTEGGCGAGQVLGGGERAGRDVSEVETVARAIDQPRCLPVPAVRAGRWPRTRPAPGAPPARRLPEAAPAGFR